MKIIKKIYVCKIFQVVSSWRKFFSRSSSEMPNSNTHVTTVATMEASTNGEELQVESTDEELQEGNLHEQVLLKSLSFSYSFFKKWVGHSASGLNTPLLPLLLYLHTILAVAHAPQLPFHQYLICPSFSIYFFQFSSALF